MLTVAAYTGGKTISSRRFRVQQYVPELARYDVRVLEHVARFGSWPPRSKILRPAWFAAAVADRLLPAVYSYRCDVTLLQREMVSTFLTLERITKRPRILDVDDAVWLTNARARRSFSALVRACDGIMCGNEYIRSTVSQWNKETLLLPTAVDTRRFRPGSSPLRGRRIIGWSGLHAGAKYLLAIEDALAQVLTEDKDTILRVVSDRRPEFLKLKDSMVEFVPWSPENEVRTIQEMSIGLMPIDDTPWSRGKCSYKMLLYMSCGVPVVVSPYGMNGEVLAQGEVGFGATSTDEWVASIRWLLDNEKAGARMGGNGRALVESRYGLETLAGTMATYLKKFKPR
jgi:glycosyltransferase involved in cell wall biosynthesis